MIVGKSKDSPRNMVKWAFREETVRPFIKVSRHFYPARGGSLDSWAEEASKLTG